MKRFSLLPALAGAALLAGCASTPKFSADVTRFHLNQPAARGTVFLESVSNATPSMEDRFWQGAVADALRTAGFNVVETRATAELIGVVGVGRSFRAGPPRTSPVSIGVGMGGGGSNVVGGVGVGIPVGKPRPGDIAATQLELTLRRASDQTTVWEGRAVSQAPADATLAQPATLAPQLAGALLADYPGPSGQTVRYPRGSR